MSCRRWGGEALESIPSVIAAAAQQYVRRVQAIYVACLYDDRRGRARGGGG